MEEVACEEPEVPRMQVQGGGGELPKIKARDFYSTSAFNLFGKQKAKKMGFSVSITVKYFGDQLCAFPLFTERKVEKMKKGGKYKYIHFGCFRINVFRLFRAGMNVPVRVGLFDTRHTSLEDAVASGYRGNLISNGYPYKDIYPNVSMPLDDAKCWNVLVLLGDTGMRIGVSPCVVGVKGVYCLANNESPAPLKEAIARRLSLNVIPVTETPEGVVKFTGDSVPRSLSDRDLIQKHIKPHEGDGEPQKNANLIKSSQDENSKTDYSPIQRVYEAK